VRWGAHDGDADPARRALQGWAAAGILPLAQEP